MGNILLAIFNGQKHLPYKEHKLTHLLKECLGSLTCHAAMIAHVSPLAQNYTDTLTTVQLASRIHRMRRRKIKFVSAGTGNGSGGSSGEEQTRTTGTSSEPDPSSSDLSADTVIYVGPADEGTDGEHPPVYIPSLNSGDNRCVMSKALKGSIAEHKPKVTNPKPSTSTEHPKGSPKNSASKTSPAHSGAKASPVRTPGKKPCEPAKQNTSDEQWIDGPRISKSRVAEARHLMKEACHVKKRETWIDGPLQADVLLTSQTTAGYGYMDSHKKSMIRKWVENQSSQIQKTTKHRDHKFKEPFKELTTFKTCEEDIIKEVKEETKKVEESVIRTGLKSSGATGADVIPEVVSPDERPEEKNLDDDDDDEEEVVVEIPPALPLIQPLSSREVSMESLNRLRSLEYEQDDEVYSGEMISIGDEEEILEIIEVEEPLEPVPMQDSCLQVTEEDIAYCMGLAENPLPEVDQENLLEHPLRILSQENLTVVSTFTDSMSVYTDLERLMPRRYQNSLNYGSYGMFQDYEEPDYLRSLNESSRHQFDQLARLHELYTNKLAKATVGNSGTYQDMKPPPPPQRSLSRCESLSLSDMLYGVTAHETSSIYSEPPYRPDQETFCQNCKVSMSRPATAHTWYADPNMSASATHLETRTEIPTLGGRFQRFSHKFPKDNLSIASLRHPDGASNPNLKEETERIPGNGASLSDHEDDVHEESKLLPKLAGPKKDLTRPTIEIPPEKFNRRLLSIESGLASIKLKQNEGYDSGHDSTPRTSKHSPAAISRRAESGYDSVVRDSESSSIDSDTSRLSRNVNRRGKCRHKHDKSFCSWLLNPFTCKYIEEPPETHF